MQRYFGQILGDQVLLADDDVFHLTRVMRAKPGDQIEVVSDGRVFIAQVIRFKPLEIDVVRELKENNELRSNVILVAALIKGEKMDFLLQKATELGVSEIVLLETERTVVKIKKDDKENKFARYRKILKEAAEQSKRSKIPTLYRLLDMKSLGEIEADVKMIAYEGEEGAASNFTKLVKTIEDKKRAAIIIGPEGGFSEEEVKLAEEAGYSRVSLGRRILRAETASFYALSVIANYLERK